MSDDISEVPRDLAGRLEDLSDATADSDYAGLTETVSALPDRTDLPECRLCGAALSTTNVFVSGDVAVALRLVCPNAEGHDSAKALAYVYEVGTRQLYAERWQAVSTGDAFEEETLTLTVEQFRDALERAAGGEPIETIVADRRE